MKTFQEEFFGEIVYTEEGLFTLLKKAKDTIITKWIKVLMLIDTGMEEMLQLPEQLGLLLKLK